MLPVFTIVGRPNVGKSTLFNFLTRTRDALVADIPGLTRDRQYGLGKVGDRPYVVVDTGGIAESDDPILREFTEQQVKQAVEEATVVFFIVDANAGLVPADQTIAEQLRPVASKVVVLVNKADRESADLVQSEFYQLGLGQPMAIAATTGRGIQDVLQFSLNSLPHESAPVSDDSIRIAVIGRPNVGKSTLINRLLGEERVMVLDMPGTTRDSIYIPFEHHGQRYTLIDTAGVRRRARVNDYIEKLSAIKTLQAIKQTHVAIVMFNAREGLGDQDLRLLGYVLEAGKPFLIAINQWDDLDDYQKSQMKQAIDRRLDFVTYARRYYISAKHGTGVGLLYPAINEAYTAAHQKFSTPQLTKTLMQAVQDHQPPLVSGRRIRLRYAHVGSDDPLCFIVHGKQVDDLPGSYQRYLMNYFRERYQLTGVPLQLQFKADRNPYVAAKSRD